MAPDLEEMQRLLHSNEPLNDELTPWMEHSDFLGESLKHPLVFQVPFYNAAMANRVLVEKKRLIDQARGRGDYSAFIYLHERPYRLMALMALIEEDLLSDEQYWSLVGTVWIDSENIWQNVFEWYDVLSDERPGREHIMDEDERDALAELPDTITIYRGCHKEKNEDGLSWTTDRARAEWFAKRFASDGDEPVVIVAEVERDNVIAYFTGRGESEIVAFDTDVSILRYEEV